MVAAGDISPAGGGGERYSAVMSQANVELAQRATDAVNDRNWDLWMDLMDPEIVYHE